MGSAGGAAAPGAGYVAPPPLPWNAAEFIEKEMISFLGLEDLSRMSAEPAAVQRTPDETVAHDDIEVVDDSEES